MTYLSLITDRLQLIAPDSALATTELEDPVAFKAITSAELPKNWPPPLLRPDVQVGFRDAVRDKPSEIGWLAWYLVLARDHRVIGSVGFKGPPNGAGMVEIGYSVMESDQRQGYCTEAVGALVSWAFSHDEVEVVRAETGPANHASIRVMQKNLLQLSGTVDNGDVRYEIRRLR